MKLLTIDTGYAGHPAIMLDEETVLDLVRAAPILPVATLVPPSVRTIFEAGAEGLELIRRVLDAVEVLSGSASDGLRETGAIRNLSETPLLAPIPDPKLILSAGMNYRRHLAEMKGTPVPEHPMAFIKAACSLTGSGKVITVPPQCPDMIDFEGEFTFVFGRTCHNAAPEDALSYVGGYTICNDVSARDWIPEFVGSDGRFAAIHSWERNIMGKQLPGFTPCGPFITTADEITDPQDLQLTTTLNREVMQSTKTDDLIYGVAEIIAYFSKWYRFEPGDLVTTGSPSGVGFGRDPKVFMKAGDTIQVEIEGIGRLTNTLQSGH